MEAAYRSIALTAIVLAAAMLPASAQAFASPLTAEPPLGASGTCVVHARPASFVARGEAGHAGSVADIVEVECNPEIYGTGQPVRLSSQELFARCGRHLSWSSPAPFKLETGPTFKVTLDPEGNATAVVWGGPDCTPGESLISAHMEEVPYETFSTGFSVLAPSETPPGVSALPASAVEDAVHSSVASIVSVEFPSRYAERFVHIRAEELLSRCQAPPHLVWVGADGKVLAIGAEGVGKVRLDNDGNAFVVVLGDSSCASGVSLIEADLESPPYTTYTTTFTVEPPMPTWEEPALAVEKVQQIAGSGAGFTSAELTGTLGQTVDYEVSVRNTGNVPLSLSSFADAHCDAGTIAGGPAGSPLAPGSTTTYTCDHVLDSVGAYTNQAVVSAVAPTGQTIMQPTNQVVARVPAEKAFTITKSQRIEGGAGAYTPMPVTGAVGATVEYEIVVANTGNVPLVISDFSDPHCDPGTLAGGPGEASFAPGASTTYTCSHVLVSEGSFTNEAVATAEAPGEEGSITHPSEPVEAIARKSAFAIEKLQEIAGAGAGFTTARLTGAVGQTVDYEIIVRNTGELPLTFSGFADPQCDAGTLAGGPGETPLEPGASTTYTCSHALRAIGSVVNEAAVTGTSGGGEPALTLHSNAVEAVVPAPPSPPSTPQTPAGSTVPARGATAPPAPAHGALAVCETAPPKLVGVGGPKRGTFTVHMAATGVARVTFYLDGRKLRTLAHAQASHGRFSIRVNASHMSYGAHRLTAKVVMSNPRCAAVARSGVFVHPHAHTVAVRFTG